MIDHPGGELVASFVAHPDDVHWCGALYVMCEGLGPMLLTYCPHKHRSLHKALACAEQELAFARRVVELADAYAGPAS